MTLEAYFLQLIVSPQFFSHLLFTLSLPLHLLKTPTYTHAKKITRFSAAAR